jgi:hypothetical protein
MAGLYGVRWAMSDDQLAISARPCSSQNGSSPLRVEGSRRGVGCVQDVAQPYPVPGHPSRRPGELAIGTFERDQPPARDRDRMFGCLRVRSQHGGRPLPARGGTLPSERLSSHGDKLLAASKPSRRHYGRERPIRPAPPAAARGAYLVVKVLWARSGLECLLPPEIRCPGVLARLQVRRDQLPSQVLAIWLPLEEAWAQRTPGRGSPASH